MAFVADQAVAAAVAVAVVAAELAAAAGSNWCLQEGMGELVAGSFAVAEEPVDSRIGSCQR